MTSNPVQTCRRPFQKTPHSKPARKQILPKIHYLSVEHLDTLAGSRQEPSSDVENQELHSQVRKVLIHMKLEDREVLVLRYSLGWSSNRIATALNSTTSAVDMRLSRARKKLAEKFDKAEFDYE